MKKPRYSQVAIIASTLFCTPGLAPASDLDYHEDAYEIKTDKPVDYRMPDLAPNMVIDKVQAHQANELLVQFAPHVDHNNMAAISQRIVGTSNIRTLQTLTTVNSFSQSIVAQRMNRWYVVEVPTGSDLAQVRQRFAADPQIDLVEYNYIVKVVQTPSDTLYSDMWNLENVAQTGGQSGADIAAPQAWNTHTGSRDAVVAVIDTGVDYTHPDLAANMWTNTGEIPGNGVDDDNNGFIDDVYGYNFSNNSGDPQDDHGHGTHVAGTIAAEGNNNLGVTGVAWQARIMALKFLDANGSGRISDAIEAILYATQMGAKLSNNSWGGGGFSVALRDAIAVANGAGSLFVAAAGNSGSDSDRSPMYPAAYDLDNIISVAATDHNDALAYFSNFGASSVDLGAPGVNILSTMIAGGSPCCSSPSGYGVLNGTSMASPHVAGAAVLVYSAFPNLNHRQVKNRLLDTVDPITSLTDITVSGGRLNVATALGNADYVDLTVASISGTKRVAPGGVIRATGKICSTGTQLPGLSYASLHFSTNPEVTLNDTRVDTDSALITDPDGCVIVEFWGSLPVRKLGQYYLRIFADYRNDLAESDETNNFSVSIPLTVKDGQADLVVKSVQGPNEATLGDYISVSKRFCNDGIRPSGDFSYGLYLSIDTIIDTNDILIGSGKSILDNGQCSNPNVSIYGKIPPNLVDGTMYYPGVIVDNTKVVPESDESNNSLAGNRIVLRAPKVDLVATELSGSANARLGEKVDLSSVVCNNGNGSLPFQISTVYLTVGNNITADSKVAGWLYNKASTTKCSTELVGSVTVPTDLPTGNYRWAIDVDSLSWVPESNEDNNSFVGNLVSISAP